MINENSRTPHELTTEQIETVITEHSNITADEIFSAWGKASAIFHEYAQGVNVPGSGVHEMLPEGMAVYYGAAMYALGARKA